MEIEIVDEIGNIDLCEVEPAPSTRILRVIGRVKEVEKTADFVDRNYQIQYAHACGYRD